VDKISARAGLCRSGIGLKRHFGLGVGGIPEPLRDHDPHRNEHYGGEDNEIRANDRANEAEVIVAGIGEA
jgi:hypothetical protein